MPKPRPRAASAIASIVARRRLRQAGCGVLAALSAFLLSTSPGCGTDAKGVEDCRDIERARCEAAVRCGIVSDVGECKRFYRDHCLHGLAVVPPAHGRVDECVAVIQRAATCVQGNGTAVALRDCSADPPVSSSAPGITYACELVTYPERAAECSFLSPVPVVVPDDNEGEAGESGSGGGGG